MQEENNNEYNRGVGVLSQTDSGQMCMLNLRNYNVCVQVNVAHVKYS